MRKSILLISSSLAFLLLVFSVLFSQGIFESKKLTPTPTNKVSSSRQLIRSYLINQFSPYQEEGLTVSPISEFEAFSDEMKNTKAFMSVKVIDGVIYPKDYGLKSPYDNRKKEVLSLLKKVVEKYDIADLELILYLGDGISLPDTLQSPVFTFDVKKDAPDRAKHFLFPDPHMIPYLSRSLFDKMIPYVSRSFFDKIKRAHSKHPWEGKIEKLYFRGATTGDKYTLDTLSQLCRPKLVMLSVQYPEVIDARFTSLVQFGDHESEMKAKKFLEAISPLSPHVAKKDHLKYKYLLCVDGNVGAWGRPLWIMSSNSVLVYHTDYIQWINPAMKPYVHYVPMGKDLTDIFLVFDWMKNHDDEVREVVRNANKLIDDTLQEDYVIEDVAFYLNQYASLCRWLSDSPTTEDRVIMNTSKIADSRLK